MTDKPKNKNRKKSLVVLSIVKVLLIIVLMVACNINFIKFDVWYWTSGRRNNLIIIDYPNEEATCKLICKFGGIAGENGPVEKEIDVKVDEKNRWSRYGKDGYYGHHGTLNYDYVTALVIKDEKVVWIAIIQVVRDKVYQGDYHPIVLQQGYLIIPREESEARKLIDQYIEQKEKTRISLWDRNLKE